ncbi:MAG: CHAT domain-containing tetratricopeptide repeat protein [Bryobacteraceae bacterium]
MTFPHAAALAMFAIAASGPPLAAQDSSSQPPSALDLNRQSEARAAKGDYTQALAGALAASRLYAAAGDRKGQASALTNAGVARLRLGDYDAALRDFEQSAALCAASGDLECEILRLNNAGGVHYYQGRYSEAARHYRAAEQRMEGHAGEAWYARARQVTLANRAALEQRLGHYQDALTIYRNSDAQGEHALAPRERARLLGNLGALYRRLGDPVRALEIYREAASLLDRDPNADLLIGVLRNTGIIQGQDLRDWRGAESTFRRALGLAEKSGNRRHIAQSHLYLGETLRARGRTDGSIAESTQALAVAGEAHLDEERWKALHALGRTQEAIEVIENLRGGIVETAARQDFLADKRTVYDDWIASQLERGASASALFAAIERLHGRTVRDRIGERGRDTEAPDLAAAQRALPPSTALAAIWRHGAGRQRAVVWITTRRSGVAQSLTAIDPLGDDVIRNLIVIPDGEFSAETELWRGRPLLERVTVSYLPAAALLAAPAGSGWLWPWQNAFAGFGDPVDSGADRLPASAGEVQAVANLIGGKAAVFLGEANRKARFLETRAAVLHLATHAAADVENPDASRVSFSGGDALYLREVYRLRLEDSFLVTLAACETERGPNAGGEGVRGFSQAFLAAGARSVVSSLRRVDDRATAALMKQFYYRLATGRSKAEALREAKLTLLHAGGAWADARYWSPFVLLGDGAGRLPRRVTWLQLIAASGAVLFGLAYAAGALLRRL